jgi:Lrp/AsnC family transcriptional regulator, leucine-responsive regulatory protein
MQRISPSCASCRPTGGCPTCNSPSACTCRSPPACAGCGCWIERFALIVDQAAVGLPGNVFAELTLSSQQQQDLDAFEAAVRKVPEVMECYLVTGEYDYLLRVVVRDTVDYERIHHEYLTKLPGVARVKSSFSLRTVAKKTALPLE